MKQAINNKEPFKTSAVDQAGLDLCFVESFIDLLWQLCTNRGDLDTLKTETVSAQCYECTAKIANIKKFIQSVPVTHKTA